MNRMAKKKSRQLKEEEVMTSLSVLLKGSIFKSKEPDEFSREVSAAIAVCKSTHSSWGSTQYGTLKLG